MYLFKPPYVRHRFNHEFIGSRNCSPIAFMPRVRQQRATKLQGSSKPVLSWQVTMDQLICASPSHTTYWHEVGVLEVPATYSMSTSVHMFIRHIQ